MRGFCLIPERHCQEVGRGGPPPLSLPLPLDEGERAPREGQEPGADLGSLLNKATGVDLTYYRRSTIWRRIMRRMALIKVTKPETTYDIFKKTPWK